MGVPLTELKSCVLGNSAVRVDITTQACLGRYLALVVESGKSDQVVCDSYGGKPLVWSTLDEARRCLRKAGVDPSVLQVRIAHDEAIGRAED
ncbi:MAG: DUF6482 family protein [Halopseudomonas yangmingensis]|uniref:Uncharacterized protein n=1 Tax=Halopseudomonas yangmingensis TaxID=1720063 RepID=A0A1I4N9V9_9GAMM|nr:hypothetical protein SAMN05216217_101153 [Halopseudomonas yangmingensis]